MSFDAKGENMSASQFPIRCFTCKKPINSLWGKYKVRTDNEEEPAVVLDSLNVVRMCCRRMFMTHVDIEHIQSLYPTYPDHVQRIGLVKKNAKPRNFSSKEIDEEDSE